MQRTIRSRITFASVTAACLLALGIVGTTIAGIQGSGFMIAAVGRITDRGSVRVNGIDYASTHASVLVDGVPADQTALRIGDVITINGTLNDDGVTGTADYISYAGDVQGVITAVDPQARTFSVLRQTVRITDDTLIDDAAPATPLNLQVGTAVEVSGFANAAGELVASRVDTKDHATAAQVRGTVAGLDTQAQTFLLNTLLIDYRNASIDGLPTEGATVLVQGKADDAAGALLANRVVVYGGLGTTGERGDVEGIITSFTSDAEFRLDGQRILGNEKTQYALRGLALGPDVPVHVSGHFEGDALIADTVEVNRPGRSASGSSR